MNHVNPEISREKRTSSSDTAVSTKTEEARNGPSSEARDNAMVVDGKDAIRHLVTEARDEIARPTTGAAIAGAAVVGAATLWGLPAAALGATAAYVVYRVLKRQDAAGT